MSTTQLILGDCTKYITSIPDSVFMISDPPYNQGYHYGSYHDKLDNQIYSDMLRKIFGNRKSVVILYPEAMMQIFGGGLYDV